MQEDHEKIKQREHWRAVAEALGLPTESEEEVPAPEPEDRPEAPPSWQADEPFVEDQAETRTPSSWVEEEQTPSAPEFTPRMYAEPEEVEAEAESTGPIREAEPEEGREERSRRGRRRGRRGKKSSQREPRDQQDQGRGHSGGQRNAPRPPRPAEEEVAAANEPPADGGDRASQREPAGEKGRRRRRGRGHNKDRRQRSSTSDAPLPQATEYPASAAESSSEEMESHDIAELRADEFDDVDAAAAEFEAGGRFPATDDLHEEMSAEQDVDEARSDDEQEQETEEEDYDIMDEEDPYADWNIPSWQELIASLYRPER